MLQYLYSTACKAHTYIHPYRYTTSTWAGLMSLTLRRALGLLPLSIVIINSLV